MLVTPATVRRSSSSSRAELCSTQAHSEHSTSGIEGGDFDHFAIDLDGHRLFLAAEANGLVEVFDTQTNKLIHTIRGIEAPHSMVYPADLKRLSVVDGDASEIKVYDTNTYGLIKRVHLYIDADSQAYDPDTKLMYVVSGGWAQPGLLAK